MRNAESRFGESAHGITGIGRRMVVLLAVVGLLLMFGNAPAATAAEHLNLSGEYGKEGPVASGLGNGCRLAYQESTQHLLFLSSTKIWGLAVSPGSATPLTGNFPIDTGLPEYRTGCGDPDLEASATAIYAVPSEHTIFGWNPEGAALGPPWPVDAGGETCGVAVTGSGEVWGGNYGSNEVTKFNAAGTAVGAIPIPYKDCKIAVDKSNGDLYSIVYGGGEIVKYTAASGYTTTMSFPAGSGGNAGISVNGVQHKLYVSGPGTQVKAYDTDTAALVETIEVGGTVGDVVVDEGTDTLWVIDQNHQVIKEYLGVDVPKATTGDPIGNSEVSGTADPNGVGPITACYFEFGLNSGYGDKADCAEPVPFNSAQSVHTNFPGLEGEVPYHYRLVLETAAAGITGRGADKTIVAHNVKGIKTDLASEVTQNSARLNASFEGTNEVTKYYFDWGRSTSYGNRTATPPGDDAGVTTGPTQIHFDISELTPGVTYHYRVVAENSFGISKGGDQSFKTYEPPSVEAFHTSNVTADSADVNAKINPNGFIAKYHIEYGTTPDYGLVAPVPDAELPAGIVGENVTVPLINLQGVTYHFRVVAENQWGITRSSDQTFNFFPPTGCPNESVRQQMGSAYLPDCRAYELVSPADTGNVVLQNAFKIAGPSASSPARFAFSGKWGAISGFDTVNNSLDNYISTRTDTSWETKYVGVGGSEYPRASGLFGSTFLTGFLEWGGTYGCCPGLPKGFTADGRSLGTWPAGAESIPNSDENIGAYQLSPNADHMAFSSNNVNFDPEGLGLTAAPGSAYDYDSLTETTTLISKDTNGAPIAQEPGNASSTGEFIKFPPATASQPSPIYPGISTDGSHILMSTATSSAFNAPVRLYMRVNDAATLEVSQGNGVTYVGMTRNGSEVFYRSPDKLTPDDHDTSVDLFMWKESDGSVTRLSGGVGAGDTSACTSSWANGCSIALAEGERMTDSPVAVDSGDVYFYSPEELADGATAGARNLYVYREGEVQLVAVLSASGGASRIQVANDGSHAAFVTRTQLTSYDNAGFTEMYGYDAESGQLICVSCLPTGEPPTGDIEASSSGIFMSNDGRTFWTTSDALVPQDTNDIRDVYEYVEGRPQLITSGTNSISGRGFEDGPPGLTGISENGTDVYFSTYDTLVPQDHNGPFFKYYDARTGGGFAVPPLETPCVAADECHGASSQAPPTQSIVSSGDLGSGGNVAKKPKATKKRKHKPKRKHSKQKHRHRNAHHEGSR